MKKQILLTILLPVILLISSCSGGEEPAQAEREFTLPDDGIELVDAWARPGRENGVSAVYMHVLNGSADIDTLKALSSSVAGLVELHETYDRGDDMMGMREAEEPFFAPRSVTSMRPGGLHVMLMQLNRALTEGDEIDVTLTFARAGEITISAVVQSP
jgi:periplasmic copper chaperone A